MRGARWRCFLECFFQACQRRFVTITTNFDVASPIRLGGREAIFIYDHSAWAHPLASIPGGTNCAFLRPPSVSPSFSPSGLGPAFNTGSIDLARIRYTMRVSKSAYQVPYMDVFYVPYRDDRERNASAAARTGQMRRSGRDSSNSAETFLSGAVSIFGHPSEPEPLSSIFGRPRRRRHFVSLNPSIKLSYAQTLLINAKVAYAGNERVLYGPMKQTRLSQRNGSRTFSSNWPFENAFSPFFRRSMEIGRSIREARWKRRAKTHSDHTELVSRGNGNARMKICILQFPEE